MAESKQLKYWSEFLLLRQKKVNLVSPMTFLPEKCLITDSADRFRQGKRSAGIMQSQHIKMVIFKAGVACWLLQQWLVQQSGQQRLLLVGYGEQFRERVEPEPEHGQPAEQP
jgi:hypothetical protein